MKTKLTLVGTMAVACAAFQLSAMPTEKETRLAEPVVRKLLAREKAALESGKKTRAEVAVAAMKLADEADTDAAKLLLMKGAFVLYVKDGNLEKAVETMNALETAISDMPPQSITNMIEMALKGVSRKVDGAQLYRLLDEKSGADRPNVEYKFNYKLDNKGNAILTGMPCVSPKPEGVLIVPSIIEGHKVTKLDEHLSFVNCDKMTKLILPAGLESVGFGNFSKGCSSLADIEISKNNPNFTSFKGVLYSKDMKKVVAYPKARDKIELSPQTKIIGRAAFNGCTFKEIEVPSGIERIESHAFAEMLNLEKIVFPASVNEIWMQLFQIDSNLRKIIFMGNAPEVHIEGIYGFFAYAPENIVIEVVKGTKGWNGKDSTDIPERWPKSSFGDRDSRPIRYIGEAKAKNNGLAGANGQTATVDGYTWSYRVNNGEATIVAEKDGKRSCAVSPAPTGSIAIPTSLNGVKVTSIGREAFKNCAGLTSVRIPEGVTRIEWEAFRNCKDLTSVMIPESVTHIDYAFLECAELESVKLPSSLKSIGYGTFARCTKLTSLEIPEGVTSIGADAFNGCSGLESVVIPSSVTSIGDRAFIGCQRLTSVTIPAGVASIGKGVFGECNALKIINVDSGNQAVASVDGVLYTKDRSELVMYPNPPASVVIPKDVKSIRGWAFAGGRGMTSVTIPESVTSIGDVVFLDCVGLKSITIPSSVKSIGEHIFERCVELNEVTMLGERPEAPNDIFKNCGKLKSIHVPANAKSWSGMKTWQGIPLVFDGEVRAASEKALNSGNATSKDVPNVEYKFSYKLEGGNAIITGIDPKPVGTLVIPDKIDGHKVTNISGGRGYNDDSPFWSGCEQMTKVVLPAGLEKSEAFCNCKSLSSIEISRSNKNFASHDGALYTKDFSTLLAYPKTLESVKLSPKTRKIGACAFRGCALKTANLPKGIMEVEPWNLCECPDLELIEFPKSLKYLGQCAACGSGKLKKIVFNGDAPQIGLAQFSWGQQCVFTGAPADLVVEVRKGTTGWMSPDSTELPERWPTDQNESRPISHIE